jgi:multidrug resistance efflux pump
MMHPRIAVARAQARFDRLQRFFEIGRARRKDRDAAKKALRIAQEALARARHTNSELVLIAGQRANDDLFHANPNEGDAA